MRRMISKMNPWAADMHLHTHLCVHCAAFKILCKIKCALYSLFVVRKVVACFMGRVEIGDSCQNLLNVAVKLSCVDSSGEI